jgi:hypothetical protein
MKFRVFRASQVLRLASTDRRDPYSSFGFYIHGKIPGNFGTLRYVQKYKLLRNQAHD